jgi:chromosome segregation ATPase
VAYSHDGKLVTCGRDGLVSTWTADGSKLKSCEGSGEPVLRCAFNQDGAEIVAADFSGRVTVWETKSGRRLGQLDANPRPLPERIDDARKRVEALQASEGKPAPALASAETELTRLTNGLAAAQADAERAKADFAAKAQVVAKLKELAAGPAASADIAEQLTGARAVREKARMVNSNALAAVQTRLQESSDARDRLARLRDSHDPHLELARAQAELQRLTRAGQVGELQRARAATAARQRELESLQAGARAKAAQAARLKQQLSVAEGAKEKSRLKALLKTAQDESSAAESAVQQAARELAAEEVRLEQAKAQHERLNADAALAPGPSSKR